MKTLIKAIAISLILLLTTGFLFGQNLYKSYLKDIKNGNGWWVKNEERTIGVASKIIADAKIRLASNYKGDFYSDCCKDSYCIYKDSNYYLITDPWRIVYDLKGTFLQQNVPIKDNSEIYNKINNSVKSKGYKLYINEYRTINFKVTNSMGSWYQVECVQLGYSDNNNIEVELKTIILSTTFSVIKIANKEDVDNFDW